MNKSILNKIIVIFLLAGAVSCEDADELQNVQVSQPGNISVDLDITQDNSGLVTITPSGDNVTEFTIDFGDGSDIPEPIQTGNSLDHVYDEGNYNVEVTGFNLNGESASITQELVVSFLPPENLEVEITKAADDPFTISVEASADFAAGFEVLFGDEQDDEEATPLMIDETISHTYEEVGTYDVTVTALSGGEATTSLTEQIDIFDPLLLPIEFESETVDYDFNNFGGGEDMGVPVVDNPNPNAVNDSQKVGSYTKVSGSEPWAGTSVVLNEPIDFSGTSSIAVDVHSPSSGTPVLLKVENSEDPQNLFSEIEVNTTVANEWETLVFTLPDLEDGVDYDTVVLFFNFNTPGTGETYYFDNIMLTQPVDIELPLEFESSPLNYNFTEFDGAPTNVEDNPDQSCENTSAQVAKTLKTQGAGEFAGASIDLNTAVDFTVSDQMQMKVWSPVPNTTVTLKFEDINDQNNFVEAEATTSTTDQWEVLIFDFSNADTSLELKRTTFFFNIGNTGAGNEYYFDDLDYVTDPTDVLAIEDFEGTAPTFTVFGNIEDTEVVANPNSSCVNTTAQVANLTKSSGSETWAGTFFELDQPLDLDNFPQISVLTHAPTSGITVKLKIEDQDGDNGGITHEVDITNTVANDWEELVYDFSNAPDADYVRIVIFFDFGNPGDGSEYYFDEIKLVN